MPSGCAVVPGVEQLRHADAPFLGATVPFGQRRQSWMVRDPPNGRKVPCRHTVQRYDGSDTMYVPGAQVTHPTGDHTVQSGHALQAEAPPAE